MKTAHKVKDILTISMFGKTFSRRDFETKRKKKKIQENRLTFHKQCIKCQANCMKCQSLFSWESSMTLLFVCIEVLRPGQTNGGHVSLPNHTFTGQA